VTSVLIVLCWAALTSSRPFHNSSSLASQLIVGRVRVFPTSALVDALVCRGPIAEVTARCSWVRALNVSVLCRVLKYVSSLCIDIEIYLHDALRVLRGQGPCVPTAHKRLSLLISAFVQFLYSFTLHCYRPGITEANCTWLFYCLPHVFFFQPTALPVKKPATPGLPSCIFAH
jgi:hypothetical protein